MDGGPLGRPVANYTFRAAGGGAPDGASVVAVRERFEIAAPFRDRPFIAVEDRGEHLLPRYEGRWGRRRAAPDRGVARAGDLVPLGVAQPRSRAGGRSARHRAGRRRAGLRHRRRHHRPRRRAPVYPPGTARREAHADRSGGGPAAVRPGRDRRPRHRHLRAPAARGGRGDLHRRRLCRLGRGAEPRCQPGVHGDRRDAVGHRVRNAGRRSRGPRALGRGPGGAAAPRTAACGWSCWTAAATGCT